MLIVPVRDGDKIDKVLKQYKRKERDTKQVQKLRARKEYEKPSVTARKQRLKAQYIQKLRNLED